MHPGGFAQRLCDGIVRLRYRAGHGAARQARPGEVCELVVSLWDTAQRFGPGHRIRLEVCSSAQPAFAVNLGTGGDEAAATEAVLARNVLYHDAARPSRLLLRALAPGAP